MSLLSLLSFSVFNEVCDVRDEHVELDFAVVSKDLNSEFLLKNVSLISINSKEESFKSSNDKTGSSELSKSSSYKLSLMDSIDKLDLLLSLCCELSILRICLIFSCSC